MLWKLPAEQILLHYSLWQLHKHKIKNNSWIACIKHNLLFRCTSQACQLPCRFCKVVTEQYYTRIVLIPSSSSNICRGKTWCGVGTWAELHWQLEYQLTIKSYGWSISPGITWWLKANCNEISCWLNLLWVVYTTKAILEKQQSW